MWSKCGNTSRGNNHGHHDKSYDNFNFTRFDQRNQFFVGVALSQALSSLGLPLVMALKFYSSVIKGLKLKVIKF